MPGEPVQEGDIDGVAGLGPGHQFPSTWAIHGAAAGHFGKNQLGVDGEVDEEAQLSVQIPGGAVVLADPG